MPLRIHSHAYGEDDGTNDGAIFRARLDAARAEVDRRSGGAAAPAEPVVGVTVAVAAYPTDAARYYALKVQRPGGKEAEGTAATFGNRSAKVLYALNLGSQVPPQGTLVVATPVPGGRFVFRYDG